MNLTERLTAALAKGAGSHMILLTGDQHDGDLTAADTLLPAAVLIAVTDRADPGVILTQRTDTMSRHPGQIAFPGGRIDPGEDVVTAALRESEEEIALPRDKVRVIGEADSYRTVTGFQVTPVIGIIPPDLIFTPSEAEVASVFEVPLAFLLDQANHVEATLEWHGHDRHYYEIMWNERRIWGATAAMIVNLARRLRWS
ncbi:CoA pyrophosphatase [Sphingomonas sp. PP-CE-1G-424]|uniref:CoA pyrophosphatase n=1 Tax=Sphingomonas sp. PP-CE-1G-424 TaxID=2135658 RepID=UPI0010543281|nr:CoA pyrophosphatase [Sphingomonas sp. PP-CE-1G-424]TCP71865.1 NUDIX domain-containing protein [Sphingomonas sp. PP-CE-1G-424]